MGIKRYYATKDNTITNAFKSNLQTRGVSGNMGQSDTLEVFSIYAQANTSSSELSRVLIEFDTAAINADRTVKTIPVSGSVSFFLKMYNAENSQTTPKNFDLSVQAVSQSWNEGLGLDMEEYSDEDASNWLSASSGTPWAEFTGRAEAAIVTVAKELLTAGTFTLTDAAGISTTYGFVTGVDVSENTTAYTPGTTVNIGIDGMAGGDAGATADQIIARINAGTNIGFTASKRGNNVTVTQNTPGTVGNKTNAQDSGMGAFVVNNFTNGTDTQGGSYKPGSDAAPTEYLFTQSFDTGFEDLEVDVSHLVEDWIKGPVAADFATATINGTTYNLLVNAATFTLKNSAGTVTTYRINGGGAFGTQPGGAAGSTFDVFFGGASSRANVVEAIRKAINATTSADYTATDNGVDVTVTQSTRGSAGNQTNTDTGTGLTVSNFTSGVDASGYTNYGFGVQLASALESATNSYYTKMFFARGSQFFHKRPVIEARWNDTKKDHRGDFFLSSSLVPASDNLMNLYLYNVVKGQLTDIPKVGTGNIRVSIYSGSTAPAGNKLKLPPGGGVVADGHINITGSHVETGIYSCSFAYASSSITTIFDVWHSGTVEYHTGSAISVKTFDSKDFNFDKKYVSKVTNLRAVYDKNEKVRFRLYTREKDWSPTIYTVANKEIQTSIIDDAYYRFTRVSDNLEVIPFGTGSLNHTRLSYDVSGSYFDLEMNMFDLDTVYELSFAYLINGSYVEQPERFRFRVE